jgi:hypothetical protein
MEFVRTLARACRAVPLALLFTAGIAAAQMAWSANGRQLNNLVGRGVASGVGIAAALGISVLVNAQQPAGHLPVVGEYGLGQPTAPSRCGDLAP